MNEPKQKAFSLMCLEALFALAFVLVLGARTLTPASVPPQGINATSSLTENKQRVVLDSSAIEGSERAIPFWANGSFVIRETESYGASLPNIKLYDASGQKSKEFTVWFSGSQRVIVNSAAVGKNGMLLVTGEADKSDGTRAFFLAALDSDGHVVHAIQTGDYDPRHVCAAPDGTAWTFGGTQWDSAAKGPKVGQTLRNFDLTAGELGGHLPRAEFAEGNFDAGGTWMRCTSRGVEIVSAAERYIFLAYGETEPKIYRVPVDNGTFVAGFAVLSSGRIFSYRGTIRASASALSGLYELVLNDPSRSGSWRRVATGAASPVSASDIYRLWGADGDSLVVSLQTDPMRQQALHWLKITETDLAASLPK